MAPAAIAISPRSKGAVEGPTESAQTRRLWIPSVIIPNASCARGASGKVKCEDLAWVLDAGVDEAWTSCFIYDPVNISAGPTLTPHRANASIRTSEATLVSTISVRSLAVELATMLGNSSKYQGIGCGDGCSLLCCLCILLVHLDTSMYMGTTSAASARLGIENMRQQMSAISAKSGADVISMIPERFEHVEKIDTGKKQVNSITVLAEKGNCKRRVHTPQLRKRVQGKDNCEPLD
ncbi:hypothetical protein GGI12_003520 [Dipsacomyces acuminosporus]|nr:hypothetical protein GGI12_003520 [Dipsacomyces acuminosporus]